MTPVTSVAANSRSIVYRLRGPGHLGMYLWYLARRAIHATLQHADTGVPAIYLQPSWLVTSDVAEMVRAHRPELIAEIRSASAASGTAGGAASTPAIAATITPAYNLLWVATNLESFVENDPRFGYEVDAAGTIFRMLEPPYYAWLRQRMEHLRNLYNAGHVKPAAYEVARNRFNEIHNWAIGMFGVDDLIEIPKRFQLQMLNPPSRHTYEAYRETWAAAAARATNVNLNLTREGATTMQGINSEQLTWEDLGR